MVVVAVAGVAAAIGCGESATSPGDAPPSVRDVGLAPAEAAEWDTCLPSAAGGQAFACDYSFVSAVLLPPGPQGGSAQCICNWQLVTRPAPTCVAPLYRPKGWAASPCTVVPFIVSLPGGLVNTGTPAVPTPAQLANWTSECNDACPEYSADGTARRDKKGVYWQVGDYNPPVWASEWSQSPPRPLPPDAGLLGPVVPSVHQQGTMIC